MKNWLNIFKFPEVEEWESMEDMKARYEQKRISDGQFHPPPLLYPEGGSFSRDMIEVTSKDSGGYREFIAGPIH